MRYGEVCQKLDELFDQIDNVPLTAIKGCRIWNIDAPYNRYPSKMINGKVYRLGKLVLERKLGRKLQSGFQVLHSCDQPRCIAEDHLYEGPITINLNDHCTAHDLRTTIIEKKIKFYEKEFLLVTSGFLEGERVQNLNDIFDCYKGSSKTEVTIVKSQKKYWVKISQLERI